MGQETATLAGGCFWCLEAIYDQLKGIEDVASGYMGGHTLNPSYNEVCTGTSGHAEVVQIRFDPQIVTFRDLLEIFFVIHDPTTLNRQGADVGTQYRSAIFYHTADQQAMALQVIKDLDAEHIWQNPIVTQVVPATEFYIAEAYHQEYFARNPTQGYCSFVIAPKVAKFRKYFMDRLRA